MLPGKNDAIGKQEKGGEAGKEKPPLKGGLRAAVGGR